MSAQVFPQPIGAPAMDARPFGEAAPGSRAADIVRGVRRMLAEEGWASLTEVTLSSGRRADVMAVSQRGDILIVEVKSCLQDFRTDRKWPEYAPWCDSFLFAVDCDFPLDRLPSEVGLVVADAFGGSVVRPAATMDRLSAARRKTVTLGFARLGAARLMRAAEGLHQTTPSEPSID